MLSKQTQIWLPVYILTFAAFIMNTSEFSPIGLIIGISSTFAMPVSTTGYMITVYAWVVTLTCIPMVILTSEFNRRRLLLIIFSIFIILQFVVAFAANFAVLLAGRIGVALIHALFWAITPPLAYKLAPLGKKNLAMSLIMIGTSLAAILGLPFGAYVGQLFGWRMTFILVGVSGALVLALLWIYLPSAPSQNKMLIKVLGPIYRSRTLRRCYLVLLFLVTGDYVLYSYTEPFLINVGHLQPVVVVWGLLVIGLGGIASSVIFPKISPASYPPATFILLIIFALCLVLFLPALNNVTALFALLFIWGLVATLLPLILQIEIIQAARHSSDLTVAVFSGCYNLGIGMGAFVGSVAQDKIGLWSLGNVAAVFTVVIIIYYAFYLKKLYTGQHLT